MNLLITHLAKDQSVAVKRQRDRSTLVAARPEVYGFISTPFIHRKASCACDGSCPRCDGRIQPKLVIGQPNDIYEQEADRVAEQVMRPHDNFNTPIHATNAQAIQKEEGNKTTPNPGSEEEKLAAPNLSVQLPQPDFLKLRNPFLERNAYSLWDPASALSVWKYNFDLFKRLGLKDDLAGKATNLTAPFAIDAQLKANKPKWWEITDSELKTTSITLSIPLFDFSADFKNWKPLPFLQE